ncbi:hypothetical protein EBME_0868 [bacterium endosymbiont of Mortierella elongata FMR23-6]|nr:hypothetical protein EBME_0868 [bacterium endosymbiont of Mortierella elongata FMR23-6]
MGSSSVADGKPLATASQPANISKIEDTFGKAELHLERKPIENLSQLKDLAKGTELGKVLGQYSAIKVGPFPNKLAETFSGGRYIEFLLT